MSDTASKKELYQKSEKEVRPVDWPPSNYDKYLEERFAKLFALKINPVPGEGL